MLSQPLLRLHKTTGWMFTACLYAPDPKGWRLERSPRRDLSPNNLTFHFDRFRHAGLVKVKREGRSMIYAARYETMNAVLAYLTENCCAGVGDVSRAAKPERPWKQKAKVSA